MPHCRQCNTGFEVNDWDRDMYARVSPVIAGKKYSVPEPTLCPPCRVQRRMIWRAELNLHKRKSDFSGKSILSMYPPEAKCKVYGHDEWWADDWDSLKYGRDFDFTRPFFEQYAELIREVPLVALSAESNENSDYVNSVSWNKNCYLIAGANHNEDCYYGNYINYCKVSVDNSFLDHCDFCYECVDCKGCNNLKYSTNCQNCSDSYFLYNCRNSHHCFGSVDLVGKEYVFMNEQLTRDAYLARIAKLQLDRRSRIEEAKGFFEKHRLKYPYKHLIGEMNENVTGNAINQCRNIDECYDVSKLEECKHCTWFNESKNCMDIYAWGFGAAECYECLEAGDNSYHTMFSVSTYNGNEVYYSYYSMGSKHLFGCVSSKKKEYCILNKQYTREQWEALVPRIIEHMRKSGEWGEFFPMSICPLAYNQTVAQDYRPITREEAQKLGAKWAEAPAPVSPVEKIELPDSINAADKGLCEKVFTCALTGKPYKIIEQEFKFFKSQGIPLPSLSWEARHRARLARRNPRQLWDRACMKCGTAIRTSYAPERPEIVYCESCYLKEVY